MDGRSYLGGRGAPLARCPSQKTIAHGDRAGAEEGGLLLCGSASPTVLPTLRPPAPTTVAGRCSLNLWGLF